MNQHKLSQRLLKLQRVLTKNKVKPITCSITFWAEDIAKNSSGISMKRIMKRSISHKILQMAEKERENKNIEFITTIYSDELYPWLSGKAPWSLEQGGTGIPPTNARTVEGIYLKPDHGRHAVEDFNEPKVHSINTWT